MNEPNYEAVVREFIATRDATTLRAMFESHLRRSFERYTCHQGGTDEFMEEFFQSLKTEPFTGGHPCNWLWKVFNEMARAAKRVTPATEAALAEALANRDAILAIELPEGIEPDWIGRAYQVATWFGYSKFIDCDLIAKRLAA